MVMEQKKTERQYKRTLRGSVGAGVNALFNGSGRRFYILEHRDASMYYKAGESQKIIVDQIELGRDSNCQVRFDETFETVSRRHAAIVREESRWKLVQLSKTNTTFLNGRPIETEWYLENGDEIQLAVGGPRLGFIIPAGKQSLVSSIKMTERLNLFRKQALAPYKRALWAMSIIFIFAISGLGFWGNKSLNFLHNEVNSLRNGAVKMQKELSAYADSLKRERRKLDSLMKIKPKTIVVNPAKNIDKLISSIEDDVFFIRTTKVVVTDGVETIEIPKYGWIATGFLTSDGRFVTAKHCVEGWKFMGGTPSDKDALGLCAYAMNTKGCKIVAYMEARSKTKTLTFKSTDFKMDRSTERAETIAEGIVWHFEKGDHSDWAYIQTQNKGSIIVDENLSNTLPVAAELHVLGFPHGWGAIDTYNFSCQYGSCKTSQRGVDNGIIKVSARNYESGNSGGPVLYNDNGKLKAVGIVSYGRGENFGGIVALSNLK